MFKCRHIIQIKKKILCGPNKACLCALLLSINDSTQKLVLEWKGVETKIQCTTTAWQYSTSVISFNPSNLERGVLTFCFTDEGTECPRSQVTCQNGGAEIAPQISLTPKVFLE